MVTKRKPVKRKKDTGARLTGHPASMPEVGVEQAACKSEVVSDAGSGKKETSPFVEAIASDLGAARIDGAAPSGESVSVSAAASNEEKAVPAQEKTAADASSDVSNIALNDVPNDASNKDADETTSKASASKKPGKRRSVKDSAKVSSVKKSTKVDPAQSVAKTEHQDSDGAAEQSALKEPSKPTVKKASLSGLSGKARTALAVVVGVLVALSVLVGVYSWDRWFRYDDATDMLGEWQIHASETTILIDGEHLTLGPDAVLSYTIDDKSKTIHFWLGDMQGGGRYRFAADRNQLIIEDGEFGSWLENAWADASWQLNQLMYKLFNAPLKDPSGPGVSVLDRAGVPLYQDAAEEETESSEEESTEAEATDGEGSPESESGDAAAEAGEASESESEQKESAEPDKEFTGSTSSGAAGGNAVTLEELQGIS